MSTCSIGRGRRRLVIALEFPALGSACLLPVSKQSIPGACCQLTAAERLQQIRVAQHVAVEMLERRDERLSAAVDGARREEGLVGIDWWRLLLGDLRLQAVQVD